MSDVILVTGATGNVGREVVRSLAARGLAARVGVRQKTGSLPIGTDSVVFDFANRATYADAVRGARAMFLLRPPAISKVEETLNVLVDAARDAGVQHIVFLSVIGADRTRYIPHYKVERHVERSGVPYTFLRAGFFAQNLGDAYREDIRDRDRLYVPAGRGRATFVDVRDLAEVTAAAFADPTTHANQAYELTGPEALTFADVATLLSARLGRAIRYEPASALGYLRHLRAHGASWTQAAVQAVLHLGLRFGQGDRSDPTLERLLGRRPTSMADYIRDHASLWTRSPP